MQEILIYIFFFKDLDANFLIKKFYTRDPYTPILHKCFYRILGDLAIDILCKRSSYIDLAQMLLQDLAEEILIQIFYIRNSYIVILQKWP